MILMEKATKLLKIDQLEKLLGKGASLFDPIDVQVFFKSQSSKLDSGNYCIRTYLSFIQHEGPEIVCNQDVSIFCQFDTRVHFKDPDLL
jgi:hypothetical protein